MSIVVHQCSSNYISAEKKCKSKKSLIFAWKSKWRKRSFELTELNKCHPVPVNTPKKKSMLHFKLNGTMNLEERVHCSEQIEYPIFEGPSPL